MRPPLYLILVLATLACRPSEAAETNPPSINASMSEAAVQEVHELHAFFQAWFRAELPHEEASFARFAEAMGPDFEMVPPHGKLIAREPLLEGLEGAYGSWRGEGDEADGRIECREVKARALGPGLWLVSYEEWQERGGEWKARRSSAVLEEREAAPGGFWWRAVHETWFE